MRLEYLYQWTLKFKDVTQELKYSQLREDMFRSNMLCVYVVWIFVVLCQAVIAPKCTTLVIFLGVATFLFTAGCILVMAEEFTGSINQIKILSLRNYCFFFFLGLPTGLQKSSAALVHHRNRRTTFIWAVIILMSAASSIGLFVCPMATIDTEVDTKIGPISSSIHAELPYGISSYEQSDERIAKSEKEYQLNVYVSATIHHNITINSPDKQTNNIGVKSINNFSSTTAGINKNWQNLIPNDIAFIKHELYKSLMNETIDGSDINITDSESGDSLKTIQVASLDGTLDLPDVKDPPDPCSHPEYLVFTWVLCLIALATGLKLYYFVKTFMAFIMVFYYGTLILAAYPDVFNNSYYDTVERGMPLASQMVILLVIFLTMVTYHARLVEVTSRLDFIWKEQAEKELANMKSNRFLNDVLIKVSIELCYKNPSSLTRSLCRTFFQIMSPATIYPKVAPKSYTLKCTTCVASCLRQFRIFRNSIRKTLRMGRLAYES